jgi:hypothetical protein
VSTVLLVRSESWFLLLPIDLLSLIFLSVSALLLTLLYFKKYLYLITAFIAVIVYLVSYKFLLCTADYIYFKPREEKLEKFVQEIIQYGKINQMSDGLRHFKSLNNDLYSIDTSEMRIDTSNNSGSRNVYALDQIMRRDDIDQLKFEEFKNELVSLGIISFETSIDGAILFTIDGLLNSCHGVAYSSSGLQPGFTDCGGRLNHWQEVSDRWYFWYS